MATAREDIEFLARSDHRVEVLHALSDDTRTRHDLCMMTDASSPTIGRILADFEDRRWISRDGLLYELTPLGEFVADRFASFQEAMETERKLRDVWHWLPHEMEEFTIDLVTDAVVSYPGADYPYRPVERVTQLLEATDTIRGFGTTLYKTSNLDVFCRRIIDGMDTEYIYAPDVLQAVVAWNPDLTAEALTCENCTILLHDSLPDDNRCGLNVMDDCIGICGHDPDSAQLEAVIDTESREAREWAVSVYDRHRADARPITDSDKADLLSEDLIT